MEEYFNWLIDISNAENFRNLYRNLINIDFFYVLKEDKDAEDFGLMLRDQYTLIEHGHIDDDFMCGDCTVLEVIIALAKICCNRHGYPPVADRIYDFIETIFSNLELCDDDSYDRVKDIIYTCLHREYGNNNRFCMFPTESMDLTEIDIMYQLKIWISEH